MKSAPTMLDQRLLIAIIVILIILLIIFVVKYRSPQPTQPTTPPTQPTSQPSPVAEPEWKTRMITVGEAPNTETIVCLYTGDKFTCKEYARCVKDSGQNVPYDVTSIDYAKCGTGEDSTINLGT